MVCIGTRSLQAAILYVTSCKALALGLEKVYMYCGPMLLCTTLQQTIYLKTPAGAVHATADRPSLLASDGQKIPGPLGLISEQRCDVKLMSRSPKCESLRCNTHRSKHDDDLFRVHHMSYAMWACLARMGHWNHVLKTH